MPLAFWNPIRVVPTAGALWLSVPIASRIEMFFSSWLLKNWGHKSLMYLLSYFSILYASGTTAVQYSAVVCCSVASSQTSYSALGS